MQIPVFYDSCLQGSRTVLNLNSQWDVKLTSNVLLWRSCLWTKKKSCLTLPHHIECNFFPLPIIKWVETEAKKLSKLRNQSRHTCVHADWHVTVVEHYIYIKLHLWCVPFYLRKSEFWSNYIIKDVSWNQNFRSESQRNLNTSAFTMQYGSPLYQRWLKAAEYAFYQPLGTVANTILCNAWANTATDNNGHVHLTFLSLHVECCQRKCDVIPTFRFQLLK